MLFAATLLAYFPALRGGFIWNDSDYVTKPTLRSLAGLGRIWSEVGATEQYYPLLHSAFWVQHQLWGDSAFGYHLTNVLLHAASAFLIAIILRRLAIPGAWLAAFLFAVHPVFAESVAWISEQKNTLSLLFYLGAALAWLRFDEKREGSSYALALALFLMALLSKSVTATLPGAILVTAWWRRGRLDWRRDVVPMLPWFVLGAAAGLFTGWVERKFLGADGASFDLSFAQRFLVAGRAIWFYLGKLAWPVDLIFIYPRWEVNAAAAWQWLFPAATLGVIASLLALCRWSRGPLAAFLFFVGSLFPTLGFFNVYAFIFSFVTDHWQYLPAIGILTLASAGAVKFTATFPSSIRYGIAILLLNLLATATWQKARTYHDGRTFYENILSDNPQCWMAHNNLGLLDQDARDDATAAGHFRRALELRPNFADAHVNLANILQKSGRLGEAISHYEKALSIQVTPKAHYNLGNALLLGGQVPVAIQHYERALLLSPDYAEAHNNLGNALLRLGRVPEAVRHLEHALQLNPDLAEAQSDLGNALARAGRIDEAIVRYETAIRLQPNLSIASFNLGNVLLQAGRAQDAIHHFENALRVEPNSPEIQVSLGNAHLACENYPEAIKHYGNAAKIDGTNALIPFLLGNACFKTGDTAQAIIHYQTAVRLRPDYADAHYNLGAALLTLRDFDGAARSFEAALAANPAHRDARETLDRIRVFQGKRP